jgi:hypothetical protein
MSVRTVRRAGKFAEAVAALERLSPKAAEMVRRDDVSDDKIECPLMNHCGIEKLNSKFATSCR